MSEKLYLPNVIIPMCGEGRRFKKAGFSTYKPFIQADDTSIIELAIREFPLDLRIITISSKNILSQDQIPNLETIGIQVAFIEPHSLGPAYTLYRAIHLIEDDEPYYISYNDISWEWNYQEVFPLLENHDAIVFTHEGFHPHLIQNNFSAFCEVEGNNLIRIKEKGSFTDDWMNEPLSIGLFYFRKGSDLKRYLNRLIEEDKIKVQGEFYPSLLMNYAVEEDKDVRVFPVKTFVHLGTPEHLNDYNEWVHVRDHMNGHISDEKYDLVVMCGGTGERMKEFGRDKTLLTLGDETVFDVLTKTFNYRNLTAIVNDDTARHDYRVDQYNIGTPQPSQIDTLNAALPFLKEQKKFFLSSNDCFGTSNLRPDSIHDADIILYGFTPTMTQSKMVGTHTYFSVKGDSVTDIHIKSKSNEDDFGLAGFFFIRNGDIFNKHFQQFLKRQTKRDSIDHFIKYLVEKSKAKVKFIELRHYVHVGTPDEYQEYNFWKNHFINIV